MTKAARERIDFTVGSGNVFRDLGLDSPEEELSKARLAMQIHDRVKALGLNVTKAALRLGIPQPKASRLLRGYADGFSTERLLTFLTKLGQDVRIVVSEARGGSTQGKFVFTMLRPAGGRTRRARRPATAGGRPP
ncbi:MAG: XRE family transcriptional regulator [Planctomycetia bacterium]|nr:XRE family transcriptional regulator [Planctomycetia bacterium]